MWMKVDLSCSGGDALRITGVPVQQGPDETVQRVGFVLSGVDMPTGYVSVANTSLDVVREIAGRCGPIDVAVLNGFLTHAGEHAVRVAAILDFPMVVLAHVEGREHGSEGIDDIRAAFDRHGLGERLCVLASGQTAMF